MKPPALTEVSNIWKPDGGLRDIYVVGTTLDDWKRFMVWAESYPCSYEFNGKAASMPDVKEVLQDHDHTHLLSIGIGDIRLHCHFFIVDEIEIDIDPREIRSSVDHDAVLSFVAGLGHALGKPIIITPENEMETPIVSYEPSNERGDGRLIGRLYSRAGEAIGHQSCDRPKELKRPCSKPFC